MTRKSRNLRTWPAVAVLMLAMPLATEAQRGGPPQSADARWPSISIGARAGYDNNANAEVIGAHLHVPILRSGRVELMPSVDVTFPRGLKEYQYAIDALYLSDGRRGGLYLGGGLAFRNTVYGPDLSVPRETRRGYSVVLGSKFEITTNVGAQVEIRWVFVEDTPIDPQVVSFGINIPVTGRGSGRGGPGS